MDVTCTFFYSITFVLLGNPDWLCQRRVTQPEIWKYGRLKWASWWQCIWSSSKRNVYLYRQLASGSFTSGRSLSGLTCCPWPPLCLSFALLGASYQLPMRQSDASMHLKSWFGFSFASSCNHIDPPGTLVSQFSDVLFFQLRRFRLQNLDWMQASSLKMLTLVIPFLLVQIYDV